MLCDPEPNKHERCRQPDLNTCRKLLPASNQPPPTNMNDYTDNYAVPGHVQMMAIAKK